MIAFFEPDPNILLYKNYTYLNPHNSDTRIVTNTHIVTNFSLHENVLLWVRNGFKRKLSLNVFSIWANDNQFLLFFKNYGKQDWLGGFWAIFAPRFQCWWWESILRPKLFNSGYTFIILLFRYWKNFKESIIWIFKKPFLAPG